MRSPNDMSEYGQLHAIFQTLIETGRNFANGFARLYESLCQRWLAAGQLSSNHYDLRQISALCLMPLGLFAAFIASGKPGNSVELAVLAASLLGVAMILSALSTLNAGRTITGFLALTIYGFGLAIAGSETAAGHPVLWLMAVAIPLEAWLMTRSLRGVGVATLVAAMVMLALVYGAAGHAAMPSPFIVLPLLFIYAGSLLLRMKRSPVRTFMRTSQTPQAVALEHAIDGAVFHLDMDGVISDISSRGAQRLGLSAEVLAGTALIERIHVADRLAYLSLLADLQENLSDAACSIRLRSVVFDAAGLAHVQYCSYALTGAPFIEADQVCGIVLVATKSEQASKRDAELTALREELDEKGGARGRLLATVSHELRTPLNSIIGFSDLLLHELGCRFENEKQREYVGLIQRSGVYLLDVVNSILDASKIEAGTYHIEPKSFAFPDAVSMCTSIMGLQAEQKSVILCDRVAASIGDMVADQRAVQQILINLVSNAVKFTASGGCVTIDARKEDHHGAAQLVFSVSDNGIGIEASDLERIGQPFMQVGSLATRPQEGTGLGLSLVKGLVELHQGVLDISSCPGKGTVVTVRLPLAGPNQDQNTGDENKQELATVIDMHRLQVERHYDWQENQSGEKAHAQDRKIA